MAWFSGPFCWCLVLLPTTVAGNIPEWLQAGDDAVGAVAQWANCTPTDNLPRELSIGIAMTSKLFKQFGNRPAAAKWVQDVVEGANFVYMSQLNVALVTNEFYIADMPSSDNSIPTWDDPSCSMDLATKLRKFGEWTPPKKMGLWHLFDDCTPGAEKMEYNTQMGLTLKKTLCRMEPNDRGVYTNVGISYYMGGQITDTVIGDITWRVFAHEVGHTFGAGHPFGEDITLVDGGIMAYGTGHFQCDLGFHPEDQDDICPVLTRAEADCSAFTVLNQTRKQFLSTLPPTPPNFDMSIFECGYRGFSFIQLLIYGVLGCCVCLCFTFFCGRVVRPMLCSCGSDGGDSDYDDEYDDQEYQGE